MRFYKNLSTWHSEKLLDYASTLYSLTFTNHNDMETLADIGLILLQRVEKRLKDEDTKAIILELIREVEAEEEGF